MYIPGAYSDLQRRSKYKGWFPFQTRMLPVLRGSVGLVVFNAKICSLQSILVPRETMLSVLRIDV